MMQFISRNVLIFSSDGFRSALQSIYCTVFAWPGFAVKVVLVLVLVEVVVPSSNICRDGPDVSQYFDL